MEYIHKIEYYPRIKKNKFLTYNKSKIFLTALKNIWQHYASEKATSKIMDIISMYIKSKYKQNQSMMIEEIVDMKRSVGEIDWKEHQGSVCLEEKFLYLLLGVCYTLYTVEENHQTE